MSVVGIVVVVVVAIFAASMLGAWLRGGGSSQGDTRAVREEMQRMLTAQAQGFAGQMGQLTQLVTQELTEVRRELEQGVTSASQITNGTQRDVTEQLRNSTDALNRLNQHLGEVQQSGRDLTKAAQTMQAVLGGPKSRGVVGEAQIESLLKDVLPQSAYESNHVFASGATATAVLRTGGKLVAIDAEFPLDACRKLVTKGEEARGEFAAAVRRHADEVASKLILPDENTLGLALMFVPSESAFMEMLLTEDDAGRVDDYCRRKHVLPVSPNSLHAYLGAILVGLKGTEFEESAKRMLAGLDEVKKQMAEFGTVHATLGEHLRQASDTYGEAGRKLAETQTALAATAKAPETKTAAAPEPQTPEEEATAGQNREEAPAEAETVTEAEAEPVTVNALNEAE